MKKNVTLRATMLYVTLFMLVSSVVCIGLVIGAIIAWGMPYTFLTWAVILFLVIFGLACIPIGLFSYQRAILSQDDIAFKNLFGKTIATVRWSEVKKIDIQHLRTLHSNIRSHNIRWIVICTEENQTISDGKKNTKEAPFVIIATRKNIQIVKRLATEHTTHAIVEL